MSLDAYTHTLAPASSRVMDHRPKILIVDDRPENLLALERLLRETGADAVRAAGGNDALKSTLHHHFALAILDVQMPEMDGYELAEYLRGDEKTRNVPIIFLTAVYSDEHHVFKGYEAGAIDFVTKPYKPEILLAKVRIFLELDRQKRELMEKVEIERARSYLENILLSMTDSVMVVSDDGVIRTANEALVSLSGYSRNEILGMPVTLLLGDFGSASRALTMGDKPSCCDAESPIYANREARLRTRQAELVPVLLSASALRMNAEAPSGVVVVAKDIRDRVEAQEALKRSEEKYRNLYESSREGIAFFDMKGAFVDANQAFLDMLGCGEDELRTRSLRELTPEKWHALEEEILENQIMARGYSDEYEKEYIRKDGSVFPAAVRVWLTRDDHGMPSGMWSLIRDVTTQRLEEQSRIMTEKMSALGMMAGGMAHELNNPMMCIHGFIEYCLKHTPAEDKKHEILGDALRETERCMDLVQNLLTFSHTGHVDGEEYRKVRCEVLFDRVSRLLAYRFEKQGIRITRRIAEESREIWSKGESMQQVLLNLMTNALDAVKNAPNREILFEMQPAGEFVRMTVGDTGCGILPEHTKRIFDPFFTTKRVGEGTGLGLSVTKSIVESHGGKIHCESEVGRGTRMEVLLPANRIEDRAGRFS
ncbi:MAG: PAS domain S-box protein [Deltaproteobacteria bacterium]|nr:PAS domain S-box protein [Deltaproteobacteria bacterium]